MTQRWRAAWVLTMSVGLAVSASARKKTSAPKDAFARCQAAEADFDYGTVLSECALAAAEPNRTVDDRVTVFQLLGFANIALGDSQKGEVWFTRLLSLKPDHELPATASPVYRKVFAETKKRFVEEGRITVSHQPPLAFDKKAPVQFVIEDKLGRVTSARMDVEAAAGQTSLATLSVALGKGASEGALTTYVGEVLDPAPGGEAHVLRYTLVLTDAEGNAIALDPAFAPVELSVKGSAPVYPEDEGGGWLVPTIAGGAAVGAVVVAIAAAGVATTVVCLATPVCRTTAPQRNPHIGFTRVQIDVGSEE